MELPFIPLFIVAERNQNVLSEPPQKAAIAQLLAIPENLIRTSNVVQVSSTHTLHGNFDLEFSHP